MNFFDGTVDSREVVGIQMCYATAANLEYAQKIGLFDSLGSGYYYGASGNFTSFKIDTCNDGDVGYELYRKSNEMTQAKATQCFGLGGTTVDSNILPLLRRTETVSLDFIDFTRTTKPASISYGFEFLSSALTFNGVSPWTIDLVASKLERVDTFGNVTVTVDLLTPSDADTSTKLVYNLDETYNGTMYQYLAQTILVNMAETSVTITMMRNNIATPVENRLFENDVLVTSCEMEYVVGKKSGGRDFGPWMTTQEVGTTTASLSRSAVGKQIVGTTTAPGYGYDLLLSTVDDGCLATCTESVTLTLPSTNYNPTYSPAQLYASTILSRCYDGSSAGSFCSTPYIVSDYVGAECLCGQMGVLVFDASFNPWSDGSKASTMVTARVSSSTLNALSPGVSNMFVNYTVSSGAALGASSYSVEDSDVASIAGGVAGGIIATVVMVGLFFVFSKPLGGKSTAMGSSWVAKTTTPLVGVQMVIIFIAVGTMVAAIFSPEAIVILSIGSGSVSASNFGMFYKIGAGDVLPYSCNGFLKATPTIGGNEIDRQYAHGCEAVRASAVISVLTGTAALVFTFFRRQRLVLPLIVIAALTSIVTLAVTKTNIIDGFFVEVLDPEQTYAYGSGFNLMVASFFFFFVALVCWVIDALSLQDAP